MPLDSRSVGTSGLNALSATLTGRRGIRQVDLAEGICGVERAFPETGEAGVRRSLTPGAFVLEELDRALQGAQRRSGRPAVLTRWRRTAPAGLKPLAGRFTISQSRRSPRPPSDTVPVPMPPSGQGDPGEMSLVVMPQEWPFGGPCGRGGRERECGGERRREAGRRELLYLMIAPSGRDDRNGRPLL